MSRNSAIEIRGARTHNLKGVNATIPKNSLTVITGVSGSGKSSLAFQTLFSEGQRRFLKTVKGQTSHVSEILPRAEVDSIQGLTPTIAVKQQRPRPNSRSTVANVTEMLDYLRILYARQGKVFCPLCQIPVEAQSPGQMIDKIMHHPSGTKLMILAPLVKDKPGKHHDLLEKIIKEGYVRASIDGQILELSELPELDQSQPHSIDVVIDRLIIKDEIRSRLTESLEQALRVGSGSCLATLQIAGAWQDLFLQRDLCCPRCRADYLPLEPATFSWSTAQGACPCCSGTGYSGTGGSEIENKNKLESYSTPVDKNSAGSREICSCCQGERLNPLAAHVRIDSMRLPELLRLPLPETESWLHHLVSQSSSDSSGVLLKKLVEPLLYRLEFLQAVGVGYLSLDRVTETLSAGELQRVRLARCLGTQLHGSCYILDEPTSGLHEEDTRKLLKILKKMTSQGNTVLCVEHNLELISEADFLIELGPQGGKQGGVLLYQGTPQDLPRESEIPTAQALKLSESFRNSFIKQAKLSKPSPKTARIALSSEQSVSLKRASLHNLKQVSLEFPLQKLICVTGVSGSGKSTLILDSLVPLLELSLKNNSQTASNPSLGELNRPLELTSVEIVDQLPPGKHSRSCPATFSGIWNDVRKILARTRLARVRGYNPARFVINSGTGSCQICRGKGEVSLKGSALSENKMTCPACHGQRFNLATLAVRYHGQSLGQLLSMTIDEALEFWQEITPIQQKLLPFQEIGLGYLSLGQSSRTLSGGESQRMKLAQKLAMPPSGGLLVLDEPSCGLHWLDVSRLLKILRRIVDSNCSVIVIEHHPLLRASSDWHIEVGPGAGQAGGEVLFSGPNSSPLQLF